MNQSSRSDYHLQKTKQTLQLFYNNSTDLKINGHRSAASERWSSSAERVADEALLEARIRSVRPLWNQQSVTYQNRKFTRVPSPPPVSRKIRARRRQPKSLAALVPPPPAYCLDASTKLSYNPTNKVYVYFCLLKK